jgi:hypothetical protein
LFDAAGEDYGDESRMRKRAAFINVSDGIIFLIDPFHFQCVTDQLGISGSDLDNTKQQSPVNLLERTIETLREAKNRKHGKINTPIAVAISKSDALFPKIISETDAINHGSTHLSKGSFQLDDVNSVSGEVESLLKQWGLNDLTARVERNFKNYRYFAVSAFIDADFDGKIDDISTKRGEDPFLSLLWQNGILKGAK